MVAGVWYPQRVGIASHFGVLSGISCFGISKDILLSDGITKEQVQQMLVERAPIKNQFVQVIGDSGSILGFAYNVTDSPENTVYVSAGHKVTHQTACDIFKKVMKLNVVDPAQQADQLCRNMVAVLS